VSFVLYNPVRYTDPTGHKPCDDFGCPGTPYNPIELANGILQETESRRYWDGLAKSERTVLANANWDRGSFNDFMSEQTSPADLWHDPLTYLEAAVAGPRIFSLLTVTGSETSLAYASESGAGSQCFYRGGCDLTPKPGELSFDKVTGLVNPTKGVSVFTDPSKIDTARWGGIFQVDLIPQGLQIIQRGQDPSHYEITPATAMPLDNFLNLLKQVVLSQFQ
jgi:hypothetical protein